MSLLLRPAVLDDVPHILALVNRFAADNVMLPRTEASVRHSLPDWRVAQDDASGNSGIVGCGALVPLTDELAEVRSLAVDAGQHGKGVGSLLVTELVELARVRGFTQVCALTLRESFFTRLGFATVDRWSISPKIWQACIYCPKFHRCDEVAVLMNLVDVPVQNDNSAGQEGWRPLLKWESWAPLKLAYRNK